MRLTKAILPPQMAGGFAATFPGQSSGDGREPMAFLSFASEGDMKFGDPASAGRRSAFLGRAKLEPSEVLGLALVHSRNLVFPSRGDDPAALASAIGGADGIVLEEGDLAASITVADCMPIWLLDRGSGAFGVLHSGWRGTGILVRALELMDARFGTRPASVSAILGPAIGSCCYSVGEARASEFEAEFGPEAVSRRGGAAYLDLRSANLSLAEASGVGELLSIEACSSCDPRLGSYRRQGAAGFTRMLAACGRPGSRPELAAPELAAPEAM
jgi:polyphenol oxidase